ncbi:uncharacterized protein IL334_001054 [Kwoniella shivajii]|uniref:Nuclear GTP-binding protein n=1 Tax=Kwoniella shivajii TaxID=564305 RepID=A0ABZ1CR79_9TREE|nr:hypothetical protein IL334_001054 [Kwoniella shivajii]
MPKIRKQTTNRKTTRDRAKIHKKSVDTKRKTNKAAKKDQTWKSKKKQDPGIPNSFPFKDQILAELAEERRKAEEEKIARREAAKAARAAPPQEEAEGDTPGIVSIAGSVKSKTAPLSGIAEPLASSSSAATDVPALIDTAIPTLNDVIDRADVICEVVDARDILGGRSAHVEGLVKDAEGKIVLLINKIDLVPREALQSWLSQLDVPAFLFKSRLPSPPAASSSKTPAPSSSIELGKVLGREEFYTAVKQWSNEKQAKAQPKTRSKAKAKEVIPVEPLVLAFMGLPSVGKTSILNSLLSSTHTKHAVAPYVPSAQSAKSPEPTTKAPVEVEIEVEGEKIRIIDTPGWEYADDEDEEEEEEEADETEEAAEELAQKWDLMETKLAGDLLRRNLGRVDKVKEAFPLVNYIIKRSNHQDLMLAYNIPFFEAGDVEAFLTGLARAQGRIKKHGTPDLDAASRVLLRDWAYNTFPYYSAAPKSASMEVDASDEKYDMTAVLEKCKSKKEMKKENAKGLIRFKGIEAVDKRDIILDDDYTAMTGPLDDSDEEDEDEIDLGDDDDEDDEEEDDDEEVLLIGSDDGEEVDLEDGPEPSSGSDVEDEEDEESEPEPEPVPAKKRKRASLPAPSKKVKRVSFAKEEKPLKGILKRKR